MSVESDQAAATGAALNGRYEGIEPERVASFIRAHPQIVPILEDLHCLSTAFPAARFVLRHLASPRVPSPEGDGHLLVVIVPTVPTSDPSAQLSDLLREWIPRQAAACAFLLVAVASDVVDPYACDEDALELYIGWRSAAYTQYLDLAHRFLDASPGSDEQALAGAELSSTHARARGKRIEERGGDPQEVLARLRHVRKVATGTGSILTSRRP